MSEEYSWWCKGCKANLNLDFNDTLYCECLYSWFWFRGAEKAKWSLYWTHERNPMHDEEDEIERHRIFAYLTIAMLGVAALFVVALIVSMIRGH